VKFVYGCRFDGKVTEQSVRMQISSFITTAFQLCFTVRHYEGSDTPGWCEIARYTSVSGLCWWYQPFKAYWFRAPTGL